MKENVFVVIATSYKRTNLLLDRSLKSVYQQKNVDRSKIQVLVLDDNFDENEYSQIETGVDTLRNNMHLRCNEFSTKILKNTRTRFNSGTGAWNTGIYLANKEDPNSFITILDDDDEYMPYHISDCISYLYQQESAEAVFQELMWKFPNDDICTYPLLYNDITPESFYIGNPGIQGSNLFVTSKALIDCGAFDETLESATDRDLMIRLLWYWQNKNGGNWQSSFAIIPFHGVIHFAHDRERITTDWEKKRKGLDRFYEKYKKCFSEAAYQLSLNRASKLFKYHGYDPSGQSIAILMALQNNAQSVELAIQSILNQKATLRPLYLLISDDNSTDLSSSIVKGLASKYPNILYFKNNLGGAAKNRNWLQQYVQHNLADCALIGRLDADDVLTEPDILQRIEELWAAEQFDVLLMSNRQCLNKTYTGYTNSPSEDIKDPDFLLYRLKQMSEGNWEAELPSCNVFVRPQVAIPFDEVASSEDHRNLVDYLARANEFKIILKADWIYCDYSIDKHKLANDVEKEKRLKARKDLYKYGLALFSDKMRISKANELLQAWSPAEYQYLGAGFSGVVFTDGNWVYKVHLPLSTNNFNEVDNILFLKGKMELFSYRKHFFPLRELTSIGGVFVLVYPYEQSEPVSYLTRSDMVSFLSEMWQMKVICRSITKENNFRRVKGTIKLIDYEIEPYNDNLFLNVMARAYIQLSDYKHLNISYNKLKRSTINNFSLTELDGFYEFVEEVFLNCARPSSAFTKGSPKDFVSSGIQEPANKIVIYNGSENPSVSLLIKACIQDSGSLYQDVKFLIKQLTKKIKFNQYYLLLDVYKTNDFLRQYTDQGSLNELFTAAEKLKKEKIIDLVILPPDDPEAISKINASWFGQNGYATHTEKGVPVTSQLFAFEQVTDDYFLQVDVDVLIGHKHYAGDYLGGMVAALQQYPKAISIGFQIYLDKDTTVQPIKGLDGSVPPDVRCCMMHKKRLLQARPFANNCNEKGWELSWYRALEKHQKQHGLASLRGGDTGSFYIHIQNYRKANRWVWYTIQQSLKNGFIPTQQDGKPEVSGDIFAWCLPKRDEELIVLLHLDKPNIKSFEQTWLTLRIQEMKQWGLVIINNTGQPDFADSLFQEIRAEKKETTIINFEHRIPSNEALHKAIHYYLNNQDSFICLLHQGDVLLYQTLLSECMNRLKIYGADVMVGKEISERTLLQAGISRVNFLNPREEPESLSNGLAIFSKYLFDALSPLDLKDRLPDVSPHQPGYNKITKSYQWTDDLSNISILVPVIELSRNPIRFDNINLLRILSVNHDHIRQAINYVQRQSKKKEGAWEKGRKTFLPNTHKIELDITYDCNLKCFHCNRSCSQAPTAASMSLEQVERFIEESVLLRKQWQLINVLGGEPTLHPQFDKIIHCLLHKYIIPHSPETTLQITSNGYGEDVKNKLNRLPSHPNLVININSFKEDRAVPYFTPFNMAPADESDADKHNYHKGCWVTAYCGIGLNHLGYFACGVAGGIERILNAGQYISSLSDLNEQLLKKQLNTYCRMCGNFTAYENNHGDFMERSEKDCVQSAAMSSTWKHLYKNYNHGKA